MGRRLAFAMLFLLSMHMLGCSSTPSAGPPYPSAVIADAYTGAFEVESDPRLAVLPESVPVRTRWNNKVVEGFCLPPDSVGARMWIIKSPSKESGVGRLLIPMNVEWRSGRWQVRSREFSFMAEAIERAGREPLPATVSTVAPGGRLAAPPDFPGIRLAM